MKRLPSLLLASTIAATAGCSQEMTQRDMLAIGAGVATGAYLGSFFGGGAVMNNLFIAAGATAGGATGYVINRRLEGADRMAYEETTTRAVAEGAPGQIFNWRNAQSGNGGFVRPMTVFVDPEGRTCRRFRAGVAFEEGVATGDGAACQQADGSWRLVVDEFG